METGKDGGPLPGGPKYSGNPVNSTMDSVPLEVVRVGYSLSNLASGDSIWLRDPKLCFRLALRSHRSPACQSRELMLQLLTMSARRRPKTLVPSFSRMPTTRWVKTC